MEQLVSTIKGLPRPTLVAVSGFGGAGKSTIARQLGERLRAPVIGIDSFQKGLAFYAQFLMWEIMNFQRLEEEVLIPFHNGKDIAYGHFDAKSESIKHIEVENTGVLVLEGVGLFRPELDKYFGYKIWIDVPLEEATARGKKRDREEYENPQDEAWDGVWKDNDVEYYDAFKPAEVADVIIQNPESAP